MAVDGGDRIGVAQAQIVKFIDVGVGAPGLVHLVHRQDHRLAGAQQHPRHVVVGGGHACFDVAHKDDHRCVLNGDLRLLPHEGENLIVGARLNAAGIHQVEGPAPPLAGRVQAVPGHARRVLHNGQTLAREFIEQHGFAHVGPADNGNQRSCHGVHLHNNRVKKLGIILSIMRTEQSRKP